MKYVDKVKEIASNEASKLNLFIENVEWVFENGVNILRIIADKDGGIDINEATDLNTNISDVLDKEDFIEEEYMLEVSSPGIECELKTDSAIKKYCGGYSHIDLVNKIAITKEAYINEADGIIDSIEEDVNGNILKLVLSINIKGRIKKLEIEKQNIKFIRKAVKF